MYLDVHNLAVICYISFWSRVQCLTDVSFISGDTFITYLSQQTSKHIQSHVLQVRGMEQPLEVHAQNILKLKQQLDAAIAAASEAELALLDATTVPSTVASCSSASSTAASATPTVHGKENSRTTDRTLFVLY